MESQSELEYSIIETINESDNLLEIQTVPSSWVHDNVLQLPRNNAGALIKKYAKPHADWGQYKCKVLYSNISTYTFFYSIYMVLLITVYVDFHSYCFLQNHIN